jgi:peptidoglycan/xylan/chitin deacetylase (PgdA/CDA1 family)
MNEGIRNTISSMARPMKLERLISLSGQKNIFPFYHTVSPESLPHVSHLYRVLKPAEFERDLDQLLLMFEPLSLGDYLENSEGKRGKRSMVLTFDDGLKGCYEFIAPLLKKKGIPATFFLNNKFIDNRGLFYRYKASLLIHQVRNDCRSKEKVATFLKISEEQVETSVRMIGWDQLALLEALAVEVELDFAGYLLSRPVYMNSNEVEDILEWGFDIGAHSSDHVDFTSLDASEMNQQVKASVEDLQKRFGVHTAYFSFPFTSDGVPGEVIDSLLEEGTASALLGTAGLKRTGKRSYIQRIPMEKYKMPALETLKAEYLYYLLKMPLGRNRLRQ